MSDYIKREERSRTFTEIADDLNDLVSELNDKIVELVKSKSADVAPVRHGRWIYEGNELVCSRCGGPVSFSRNNDGLALSGKAWVLGIYCQTCGAKMDEGGKDERNEG